MAEERITTELKKKAVIDQSLLDACVHCGLCLPACPTYLATGRELESPRGRIYMLNLWQQGEEPLSARMTEHLDSCLGCLGCQTACPSNVNYEAILNQARPQMRVFAPIWQRLLRLFIFRFILTNDKLLRKLGEFLKFWQEHHIDSFVSKLSETIHINKLPQIQELLRWQSLLPKIPEYKTLSRLTSNSGKELPIVQIFKGCVMDVFYNQVNQATIQLASQSSQIVAVPEQTCCGALAMHAGEKELTTKLAMLNIDKFANNSGPIIVTASGCTAMLKIYHELFPENDPWREKAKKFSSRIQDLPEYLAKHDLSINNQSFNSESKPVVIAYHAACHLAHAQGIHSAPRELLETYAKSVNNKAGREAVSIVPLTEEEHCCGSAGIYNLSHREMSETILARKMEMIKKTGADLIVTTNPGCLMQLTAGADGLNIKVLHLAELLVSS
jgi:glycolate oxidase iron-sulfur subunit